MEFEFRDVTHAFRVFTGHRGWVTRRIQLLAGSVGALETAPRSAVARAKVSADISALDDTLNKADACFQALQDLEDAEEEDITRATTAYNTMHTNATTARNRALTAIATAEANDAVAPPAPAPAPAPGPPMQAASALKPPTLLHGSSPSAVKTWTRKFKAYFSQLGADTWTPDKGHALLANNVDAELWTAIEHSQTFAENAPVLPADPATGDSLLEMLDLHFVAENPVFNRRVAWHQITQSQGQASSIVVSKIREDALLADIDSLTFDKTLVL